MRDKVYDIFLNQDFEITEEDIVALIKYYELLREYNSKFNLTSITENDEVIIKHFLDSAMLTKFLSDTTGKSFIDIGTGAGFPGMVLAIFMPHSNFTLVEASNKKCMFLNAVKTELSLDNVSVICGRAEELGREDSLREKYDFALSRAVARLNTLLEYLFPFVKVNGKIVCYK